MKVLNIVKEKIKEKYKGKKEEDVLFSIKNGAVASFQSLTKISDHFIKPDNIVFFISYYGKQYSCNPKAIYNELLRKNKNGRLKFVWAFDEPEKYKDILNNKYTKVVKLRSPEYFHYLLRSKVVVTNTRIMWHMLKPKGQKIIETWHAGGTYKKTGIEFSDNTPSKIKELKRRSAMIDYFISSGKVFTAIQIRKQYQYKKKVLNTGLPRNDILINPSESFRNHIRKKLGIDDDLFVALYAPTFRDYKLDRDVETIDIDRLKKAIKDRFGPEAVIFYRGHPVEREDHQVFDKDVSDYPDMQELLLACDMLITDYSSSVWDYSFTGRPCFLFTPDLEEYKTLRGFGLDIYKWGFPVCKDNDTLVNAITRFDENDHKKNMDAHHKMMGSYETGEATKKVCDLIRKICFNNRKKSKA